MLRKTRGRYGLLCGLYTLVYTLVMMAWIDAYDLTRIPGYLAMAQTIFADMTTQWDTTTCGSGVWWSKDLKHSAY